jgi:2-dehydropantoate 2-reductase
MIVVLGAGAVGSYYAGLMAKSKQKITLLAKPRRAHAIREQGLTIQRADTSFHCILPVSDNYHVIEEADILFLCLKTTNSVQTAIEIKPFLKPNTLILSMQNGLCNAQELFSIVKQPVYVAMIYAALAMRSDTLVSHQGGGQLVLGNPQKFPTGESDLKRLVDIFRQADCPVKISENITQDLWSKWIINCAINALSALGRIHYQALFEQDKIPKIIESISEECFLIARADGITLDEQLIIRQIQSIPNLWPMQKSSMAQDFRSKKSY